MRQRLGRRAERPGPVAPRPWPEGRVTGLAALRVSRETTFESGVSRETPDCSSPPGPSLEGRSPVVARPVSDSVPEAEAVASSKASAARAASMRPAMSDGIATGPGRAPRAPRISSRESRTSAHRSQSDRWARTWAERSRGRIPSVRAEISATSGCSSVPNDAEDADVMRVHLRPSRPGCLVFLSPVGRTSPASGSFPPRPVGYPLSGRRTVDGSPRAADALDHGHSGS